MLRTGVGVHNKWDHCSTDYFSFWKGELVPVGLSRSEGWSCLAAHPFLNLFPVKAVKMTFIENCGDFPGSPVIKTLGFHYRGHRFHPGPGTEVLRAIWHATPLPPPKKERKLWSGLDSQCWVLPWGLVTWFPSSSWELFLVTVWHPACSPSRADSGFHLALLFLEEPLFLVVQAAFVCLRSTSSPLLKDVFTVWRVLDSQFCSWSHCT